MRATNGERMVIIKNNVLFLMIIGFYNKNKRPTCIHTDSYQRSFIVYWLS